jgi:xanthine/uracil permease
MRYGSDDQAPIGTMWLMALQLCSITSVYIIYLIVLLRETGAALIALSFLMLGIATVLQAVRPFGPGFLIPVTFSSAYLLPAIAAVKLGCSRCAGWDFASGGGCRGRKKPRVCSRGVRGAS